jgi:hypothetical protein
MVAEISAFKTGDRRYQKADCLNKQIDKKGTWVWSKICNE